MNCALIESFGDSNRVWPFARAGRLIVSVAVGRPRGAPRCELYESSDGKSLSRIGEFQTGSDRPLTTGQPYITGTGAILVPVWDVRFYDQGAAYMAILRSENGADWSQVYVDEAGTYAKHFFESADGRQLFIGVGRGGGGRGGVVRFTPDASYLLHSSDDGRTWRKVFDYPKPSALYSGAPVGDREFIVATREARSLLRFSLDRDGYTERGVGSATRSVAYIREWEQWVVTLDRDLLVSSDAESWRLVRLGPPGAPRYPLHHNGSVYLSLATFPSLVVATDGQGARLLHAFWRPRESPIVRMAKFGDALYLGGEFDGRLFRIGLARPPRKIGWGPALALRAAQMLMRARLVGYREI